MNEVYALFLSRGDDFTYSSDVLIGVFESRELAEKKYNEVYGDKIKRYNTLLIKSIKNKLSKKEEKEFNELSLIEWIRDSDYVIQKFNINEIMLLRGVIL